MKRLFALLVTTAPLLAGAEDIEPGVATSSAAVAAPVTAPAPPHAATPAVKPAAAARHAHDQIDLDATQITGNRELPNVMYVVPWKKPDLGDFAGRPPKSLLDELLAPVDRDVFRRQNRYFAALHPDAAATAAPAPLSAAPAAPLVPATGAAPVPPAGDEK